MKETRKRLPITASITLEQWDAIIDEVKENGGDISLNRLRLEGESSREWTEGNGAAYFKGVTEQVITSLDEAIVFSRADMTKWQVKSWTFKSYDTPMKLRKDEVHPSDPKSKLVKHTPTKVTNYAVQVNFIERDQTRDLIQELLDNAPPPININRSHGKGIGVTALADFHFGAEVKDLLRTKSFNLSILKTYLEEVAEKINKRGYNEVHLCLLGDYFEAISGLNHKNSFKSLSQDGYGRSIIKLASKYLIDHLISRINNLAAVYMVSGNHDRITPDSNVDNMGEAAAILYDYLRFQIPTSVTMKYHPVLLSEEIDGIQYVMTHGHYKLIQKSPEKILFQHGNKGPVQYTSVRTFAYTKGLQGS